jgi:hypothetical protein
MIVWKYLKRQELIELKKPKYAFVTSHIVRRSSITILLQKGMPPAIVMKLSVPTDLKTLMKMKIPAMILWLKHWKIHNEAPFFIFYDSLRYKEKALP